VSITHPAEYSAESGLAGRLDAEVPSAALGGPGAQNQSRSSSVADLAEAAVRVTEELAAPMFARFTGFVDTGCKLAQTRPAI